MTVHIALLRGINVGRAKRIAMADLRAVVGSLGYGDVRTLLNSGNVVFTAGGHAKDAGARIGTAIEKRLGVSSRVTVISAAVLKAAIRENPLAGPSRDPSRLLTGFLADRDGRTKLKPVLEQDWSPEEIALGRHAVHLWFPEGIIDSRVAKALDRALGDGVTSRNRTTLMKLQAMVES